MPRASRVECRTAARTDVPTAHVLVDRQLAVTLTAEYGLVLSLFPCPDLGRMMGKRFVAAYTSVVLVTTLVFDCYNVSLGAPVGALCPRTDVQALNLRSRVRFLMVVGV